MAFKKKKKKPSYHKNEACGNYKHITHTVERIISMIGYIQHMSAYFSPE